MPRVNTETDFWNKVNISSLDECWTWKLSKSKSGYGKTFFNGKDWRAHRLAWFLTNGDKPESVCHKCDNPSCVNPNHLFAGNNQINTADRHAKGRDAKPKGEKHPLSKLKEHEILDIRVMAEDGISNKLIAAKYKIHKTTVRDIIARRRWKHI
jgi:hypothetical protein